MRLGKIALVLTVVAILAFALTPTTVSDAADVDDVGLKTNTESIDISAGSSYTFEVIITNNLEYISTPDLANQRLIGISISEPDDVSASCSDTFFTLAGQESEVVSITLTADKYSTTGTYELTITLSITSLDTNDTTVATSEYSFEMNVTSPIDTGTSFNKILGIWENPLPEPLNTPLATAVLSFLLAILLGIVVIGIVTPILIHAVFVQETKNDRKGFKKKISKFLFLMVIIYSAGLSLSVYGAPVNVISTFQSWSMVFYILLGAIIAWRLYGTFISYTLNKLHKSIAENANEDDEDSKSDLEPLFLLIGKIVIGAVSVATMMASFGLDFEAIIMSAGLVSLGITYGAQSIINQFFSGMVLLITRPFKAGDLIQIGTNTKTYKVKRVTVMNTVFENWANEEFIIMPNNSVASSAITNMTGKDLIYKIHVYMTVAYGENLEEAKRIMLDIGMKHPEVITDGSIDLPYVRVTEFQDSAIQIRLTAYVNDYNDYSKISCELAEQIYNEFMARGINIPFPQLDVHLDYIHNEK